MTDDRFRHDQSPADEHAEDRATDGLDPVADFWSATALEPWNVAAFWARVNRPPPPPPILPRLTGLQSGQPLPVVNDRFQRRLEGRRSGRDFSDTSLSRLQLARLLASAGVDPRGRRVFPRAGDFDSVHLFVLARRVEGCGWGTRWRYDHLGHTLVPLDPPEHTQPDGEPAAIGADAFATMCSLTDDDPAAVVVFVIEPERTVARYGAHGERFGLQEVGHAMQNLLLRMAEDGLTGYPMGGLVDSLILDALELSDLGVRVGGGLAVGHRSPPPHRRGFLRRSR